jgi:hypothetical protein
MISVPDAMFDIDIEEYDMYSYKLTNPRIRTSREFYIKNLRVLVNGVFNPQHATYSLVNKKVNLSDGVVSPFSMILLKDKGIDDDRLSFTFEHIGFNAAPIVVKPPVLPTATPTPTPTSTVVPVVKLSSVAGFQQTLWPILKNRCAGCHGVNQPPLHAAADVNVAHTNVIQSGLVNFINVPNSILSTKLKNGRHNCGNNCDVWASEIEGSVTVWKVLSGK